MRLEDDDGLSGPVVAMISMLVLVLLVAMAVVFLSGDDDDEGALDTLPAGGTLETLPAGTLETLPLGTLETLPASTTTAPPPTTTTSTTTQPPPPVVPDDLRDVLGPLLGDDRVDDAFAALQPVGNVTTFDRPPQLEGPGLTFVRSGLFDIPGNQETFDRWDDNDIPHVLSDEYALFVGILDAPPQVDDGIERQLGLVFSEGEGADVPPDLGAGHLGSSGVFFFQAALDPDDPGDGWIPAESFDVAGGFTPTDSGAHGFIQAGNTTTAVLVPKEEVGDSILSGLIFGRLTEGEPANNRQPATTRTVTLLFDPFGDGVPPLPPLDPGRFEVTGSINGEEAEVRLGDGEDLSDLTLGELLVKLAVKNGCGVNDHFWVFAAAESGVEYTVTVTDTVAGSARSYESGPFLGQPAPAVVDTAAFATCP